MCAELLDPLGHPRPVKRVCCLTVNLLHHLVTHDDDLVSDFAKLLFGIHRPVRPRIINLANLFKNRLKLHACLVNFSLSLP